MRTTRLSMSRRLIWSTKLMATATPGDASVIGLGPQAWSELLIIAPAHAVPRSAIVLGRILSPGRPHTLEDQVEAGVEALVDRGGTKRGDGSDEHLARGGGVWRSGSRPTDLSGDEAERVRDQGHVHLHRLRRGQPRSLEDLDGPLHKSNLRRRCAGARREERYDGGVIQESGAVRG